MSSISIIVVASPEATRWLKETHPPGKISSRTVSDLLTLGAAPEELPTLLVVDPTLLTPKNAPLFWSRWGRSQIVMWVGLSRPSLEALNGCVPPHASWRLMVQEMDRAHVAPWQRLWHSLESGDVGRQLHRAIESRLSSAPESAQRAVSAALVSTRKMLTATELAEMAGVTRRGLDRALASANLPLAATWVRLSRMCVALTWIRRTDHTTTEICRRTGWETPTQLRRALMDTLVLSIRALRTLDTALLEKRLLQVIDSQPLDPVVIVAVSLLETYAQQQESSQTRPVLPVGNKDELRHALTRYSVAAVFVPTDWHDLVPREITLL